MSDLQTRLKHHCVLFLIFETGYTIENISPILPDPFLFSKVIDSLADHMLHQKSMSLLGLNRGFILVHHWLKLNLPFALAKKLVTQLKKSPSAMI